MCLFVCVCVCVGKSVDVGVGNSGYGCLYVCVCVCVRETRNVHPICLMQNKKLSLHYPPLMLEDVAIANTL